MQRLGDFVRENNITAVRECIQDAKKKEGCSWQSVGDRIVPDACRDAILLDRKEIVQLFLDEGLYADYCAHETGDSCCLYSLPYFAAKAGRLALLQLLVIKGAKIKDDRRFGDGDDHQGAMRAAITEGHEEVVQYLLEHEGSSNGVFWGVYTQTFLGKAAWNGKKGIVDLLAQHGAHIKDALRLNNEWFRKQYDTCERSLSQYGADPKSLIEKRDALLLQYSNSIQMILDHAMGINFEQSSSYFKGTVDALAFLKDLDISGFNFP